MDNAPKLRHAIQSGWNMLAGSWSVWLLLTVVNLFFIGMQQRLMNPALNRLLPRIPAPEKELVPVESYIVLLMEGTHELLTSPFFHKLVLALGLVTLLKMLLQPFLHIFVFSPLVQPEPTVSFFLLWRALAHRFPAFLAVAVIQWLWVGLAATGAAGLALPLAQDVWRTGNVSAILLLLLILVSSAVLFSWGFSLFTMWQAGLARGERLWGGALTALQTVLFYRPLRHGLLPVGFWVVATVLAAAIHRWLPLPPKGSVFLAAATLPLLYLWLTYTIASSFTQREG